MQPYEERPPDETRFARDFSISRKQIFWVSLTVGFYCTFATWLIYAGSRYWLIDDASGFGGKAIAYTVATWAAYVAVSYRTMLRLDGKLGSGKSWVAKQVAVKLLEPREHRKFG